MSIFWQANYADGTVLRQADGGKYGDIQRDRLIAFDLWSDDPARLLVRVDLRDDDHDGLGPRRLIWRMRTELNSRGESLRYHLVGWQRSVSTPSGAPKGVSSSKGSAGGRNVQALCYVFEDGGMFLGGQFVENDPYLYSVPVLDCEADRLT